MLICSRYAKVTVLLILVAAAGCSSNQGSDSNLFSSVTAKVQTFGESVSNSIQSPLARTGLYLHDDQYQQKADSAVADFNKIDLSSKFDAQFKTVTNYDNEEDQAVAALQTASRNWQLQQFIQLSAWDRACPNPTLAHCSGKEGLRDEVQNALRQLTGHRTLTRGQHFELRLARENGPAQLRNQDTTSVELASAKRNYADLMHKQASEISCPSPPMTVEPPESLSPCGKDPTCFEKRIQRNCWELENPQTQTKGFLEWLGDGDLLRLIRERDKAAQKQADDNAQAQALKAEIAKLTKPDTSQTDFDSANSKAKTLLTDSNVSALTKYVGNSAIIAQLQSLMSDQLAQNAPKPASDKAGAAKTDNQPTRDPGRIQAVIDLATSGGNLAVDYAGQSSFDRVNYLLLATAYARHQAEMAKLDADYQDDLIRIYNAEIDARFLQAIHLSEANFALDSNHFIEDGFASPPPPPPSQINMDALAAWTASQDEGEIPYQVLAAKEVQLLRAQSVKIGQMSNQDYQAIIKPVLAQLDSYAKGGVTKEAIVQALGFVGVISSISAK
jgi:hypothetical protein